jgi:hypothetical protein
MTVYLILRVEPVGCVWMTTHGQFLPAVCVKVWKRWNTPQKNRSHMKAHMSAS